MHAWQRRRIDPTKLLKNACGILFQMRINAKPISANVTGWFGRWRSRRTISSKHAQWVKDRVKLLAMVTHQHFMSDSHALLAQHVVERCPAEIWRCWPELGWTEWHKAEQHHLIPIAYTGQISGDNNQWCSAMCCYASPHHNTATTKRLTLNDAGVCISFSYTAVNTRTVITAVLGEIRIHL